MGFIPNMSFLIKLFKGASNLTSEFLNGQGDFVALPSDDAKVSITGAAEMDHTLHRTSSGGDTIIFDAEAEAVVGDYQDIVTNTAGLQHYWKMDNSWNDAIGAYHGARSGTGSEFGLPIYGVASGAFNGVDDKVVLDYDFSGFMLIFSLELLVKRNTIQNTYAGIFMGEVGSWGLYFGSDNCLHFGYVGYSEAVGITPIIDSLTHHVAITFDGSILKIYLDGIIDYSGAYIPSWTNTLFTIGKQTGAEDYINALIDEVALYDVVLTPEQIALHSDPDQAFDTNVVLKNSGGGVANFNLSGKLTPDEGYGNQNLINTSEITNDEGFITTVDVHPQGTDQGLDEGGANAITASSIKAHVDSMHPSFLVNQILS